MRFLCFPHFQGKVKAMPLNYTSIIEPTPNYDCHVAKESDMDVLKLGPVKAFDHTQVSLFINFTYILKPVIHVTRFIATVFATSLLVKHPSSNRCHMWLTVNTCLKGSRIPHCLSVTNTCDGHDYSVVARQSSVLGKIYVNVMKIEILMTIDHFHTDSSFNF